MKAWPCAFFCFAILLAACTKSDVQPSSQLASVKSTDNISAIQLRTKYITAHPWKYQGWYFHYVDQQHKGDPQYIRGDSNNIDDLNAIRYLFKNDGTYIEIQGKYQFPGTWSFTDSTATLFTLNHDDGITDRDSLILVNNNHFNFVTFTHYHNTIYTEFTPAK